jgi:hypothetical protein
MIAARSSPHARRVALGILIGGTLAAAAGAESAQAPLLAAALTVFGIVAVITVTGSWLASLVAVPAAFVATRLPLGSATIAPDDFMVVVGALAPALFIDWRANARLKRILGALAVYEAGILISVLAAPSFGGYVEVLHRAVIVGGSLLIGVYLAQRNRASEAVTVLLVTSTGMAVASVLTSATSHFGAAFPLGLNKNYAGSLLSSALIVSYAVHVEPRTRLYLLRTMQAIIAIGLVATLSRGAMIGLGLGTLVWAMTTQRSRGLVLLFLIVGLPVAVASLVVDFTVLGAAGSAVSHLQIAQAAIGEWLASPVLGNGIRFFQQGSDVLASDPHDVVILTLAESGVVGLLAFAFLLWRTGVELRRMQTVLGATGLALLVARLAHGMFDVYWLHGSLEMFWIVAGMALAACSVNLRLGRSPGVESRDLRADNGPAAAASG